MLINSAHTYTHKAKNEYSKFLREEKNTVEEAIQTTFTNPKSSG